MDNFQLNNLLKRHELTKHHFHGVFPHDSIPKLEVSIHKPSFIVVNQDSANQNGSHWVVYEINPLHTNKNTYFDSYGQPPPKHMIKSINGVLGKKYTHNKQTLQGLLSTTCGQWCMLFILERCKGTKLKSFLSNFSKKDLNSNDLIVNAIVEKEFQTDQDVVDLDFILDQTQCKKQGCKDRQHNEHFAQILSVLAPKLKGKKKKLRLKGKRK